MPTKFNVGGGMEPTIPIDMARSSLDERNGSPDNSAFNTGAVLGSVLDQIATPTDKSDQILGQYAGEASEIVGTTEGYASARQEMMRNLELTDPKDTKTLEMIYDNMESLRNGEIQGAVSPTRASALINAKTKEYIQRYPALAQKIRALRAGFMEDVPRVSGYSSTDKEPEWIARDELMKAATLAGRSYSEELGVRRAQAENELQKLDFEARARAGVAGEADFSKTILSEVGMEYKKRGAAIAGMIADPNFKGDQVAAQLGIFKSQIIQSINLGLANAQSNFKFNYSKEYEDQIVAQATAPLNAMIESVRTLDNPASRAAFSKNVRSMLEDKMMTGLYKSFGPALMLANSQPSTFEFINDLSKYRKKATSGMLPTLRAQAKYDARSALMLSAITGEDIDSILAQGIAETDEGKPQTETGNPDMDNLRTQLSIDAALSPGVATDSAHQAKMLATIAKQPNAFEAYDNRTDAVKIARNYPEVLTNLQATSPKILVSKIRSMNSGDVSMIKFDALDLKEPFKIQSNTPVTNANLVPGLGPSTVQIPNSYVNPASRDFVAAINQQVRVFRSFGMPTPELQKWAATQFDEVTAALQPGYSPTPTAPNPDVPQSPASGGGAMADEPTGMLPLGRVDGMLQQGTIDLDNRIKVENEDGSFSTLRSITIEEDGHYVLIPTLNPKGVPISDEDAVLLYQYTGDHLGIFKSQEAADTFAKELSLYMGRAK